MKALFDAVVLTVKLNIAKVINLYLCGGRNRALARRSQIGNRILGQQSEEESKQAMTKKSISITSAMLITLSLPLAHAGVGMPGTITVADLAKETLAKKTLKRAQASAAAVADEADQLRRISQLDV